MGSTEEPPPPPRDKLPTFPDVEVATSGAPRATSQHPPDRGMLVQTAGLEAGRVVALVAEPITIGSGAACTARVADEDVATLQARVVPLGARWIVEDVGGGTFVDDEPASRVPLEPGARLAFASVAFRYQLVDAGEEASLTALYDTSVRDGLSGLFNGAHLLASLAADVAYAKRRGEALAILVLDVVGMRAINQAHGHTAGDEVLKRVFERARLFAGEAPLFRSGGDELTLIVRREGEAEARRIGERIRAATAASPITYRDVTVTVSLRLATAALADDDGPAMLARARALLTRSG